LRYAILALSVLLIVPPESAAQQPDTAQRTSNRTDTTRARRIMLDAPVLDWPRNFGNGRTIPTMQQSLAVTRAFYQAGPWAIDKAFRRTPAGASAAQLIFELVAFYVPPGEAWLHEEWHRAVLSRRGIHSYNDTYKLKLFAGTVRVSDVRDEDLVRFKRDHPTEFVRLAAAGIEGEYQQISAVEKDRFFFGANAYGRTANIVAVLNSITYLGLSSFNYVNRATEKMNQEDGTNIRVRDFTGWDFTAWVYDLYRPDEPYAARGVHPSGVGIDRYIKPDDLTPSERHFLRIQGALSLLNLIDPPLFGRRPFTATSPVTGRPLEFQVGLRHLLTSFGYTVDANIFWKEDAANVFVILHSYFNRERYFPGAEAELLRYSVRVGGRAVDITPRLAAWLQPDGQRFRTAGAAAGVLGSMRLEPGAVRRLAPYLEIEAKTAGWVAGNVDLGSNVSLRLGVTASLR
jgi:hypothetical protein